MDKFIGEHILLGNLQVQIITGHSDKMKKLVKELLVDYGIESEQSFFDNSTLNIKLT